MNNDNFQNDLDNFEDFFGIDVEPLAPEPPKIPTPVPPVPPKAPAEVSANAKPKFEIHIDDGPQEIGDIAVPDKPVSKGEIYFSNRKAQGTAQNSAKKPFTVKIEDEPDEEPVRSIKKAKPSKEKSGGSGRGFAFKFLAAVIFFTVIISMFTISCINDVLAIGRSEDTQTVSIPENATTDEIIDILSDNKLIHQKTFCKFFVNLVAELKHSKEPTYLSGIYYVEPDLGVEGLLNKFKESQKAEKTVTLVFPEGWSIYQIVDKLSEYNVCSKDHLLRAIKEANYSYSFLDVLDTNKNRTFKLEGYFFPDTYEFFENSDPNSVIRKFLSNFETKWTDEFEQQRINMNMSIDEVIIIASIIQREAANSSQMADISSVIHNRLDKPVSWPTLGCDSSLNYIDSYVSKNVTPTEAEYYERYYDLSTCTGLPPGPICNPGSDAIRAALFPSNTNYYYFCHDKRGNIYMATTQSEFDRNLLKVLRTNNG